MYIAVILEMVNSSSWKYVYRLLVTLVILTLGFVCVVNIHFNNLKGFWLMPAPISSVFEEMKTLLWGSQEVITNRENLKGTVAAKRTLIEVYEGLRNKDKRSKQTSERKPSTENVTIYILWYNKPVWINLDFANRVLSSAACSYDNCRMSEHESNLSSYAAIIFSFTHKLDFRPPMSRAERSRDQAWIFFGLESPLNHDRIFYRHNNWKNTMNWSMSYRRDADIFFPYGMLEQRREQINRNYSAIFSRKTRQAAWLVSNCGAASYRDEFVSELQRYGINVDIFGVCANNVFRNRDEIMSMINKDYKFFFSFENSLCTDYVTEKFFRYFNLDAILVVRGGADYDHSLPNDTFLNADHFESPKALAKFLLKTGSSEKLYLNYIRNKDRYIASEMFTMSTSYCSICEKLNNLNNNRKTYEDHVTYIHDSTCWTASDVPLRLYVFKDSILTAVFLLLIISICVAGKRTCLDSGKRKRISG